MSYVDTSEPLPQISHLYQYDDNWRNTTIEHVQTLIGSADANVLIRPGGDYGYFPVYYAVFYCAPQTLVDYIVDQMVGQAQFPKAYRDGVNSEMIYSLYDHSYKWEKTSIEHVKLLVQHNEGVLTRRNMFGELPIFHAVAKGARREVVQWMAENTGIDLVKGWRCTGVCDTTDKTYVRYRNTGGTLLHLATWNNHSHLLPFLLYIFDEDAVNIKTHHNFTPLGWATKFKFLKCVDLLTNPVETVEEYKEDPKRFVRDYTSVTEIKHLYENTSKWKNTPLSHVQHLLEIGNPDLAPDIGSKEEKLARKSARLLKAINASDEKGNLVITYAINNGAHLSVVKWVADTMGYEKVKQWRGNIGETLLHYAAYGHYKELIPFLFTIFGVEGITLIDDKYDETPIQWSQRSQYSNNLQATTTYLQDPAKTIDDYLQGDTSEQGDGDAIDMVRHLLEYSDRWRTTKFSHIENIEKGKPGSIIQMDEYGFYPIIYAAWKGCDLKIFRWMLAESIKQLQEKNAPLNRYGRKVDGWGLQHLRDWRDTEKWSILHYAATFDNHEIVLCIINMLGIEMLAHKDAVHNETALEWARKGIWKVSKAKKSPDDNSWVYKLSQQNKGSVLDEEDAFCVTVNLLETPEESLEDFRMKHASSGRRNRRKTRGTQSP